MRFGGYLQGFQDVRRKKMQSNKIPVLFNRKEECCGCTACYAVCPKKAIMMLPDEEGFEYPVINDKKCVCCKKCIKVCPIKNST